MAEQLIITLDSKFMDAVRGMERLAGVTARAGRNVDTGGAWMVGTALSQGPRWAMAAAAATTALAGLARAAPYAASQITGASRDQIALGSSMGTTAMLRAIGAAVGVGNVGSSAAGLHAATLSGLGAATATRFGIPIRPHELGTGTDRGEMMLRAIEGLRKTFKEQGMGATIASARNLNIEEWVQTVYLLDEQFKELRRDIRQSGGLFGQDKVAGAVRLNFEMARLSKAFTEIGVSVGSVLIRPLQALTRFLTMLSKLVREALPSAIGNMFGPALKPIIEQWLRGGQKDALGQNTKQMRDLTDELRQLNGIYGGGGRAASAIPGAFGPGSGGGGYELSRALRAHTIRLGAYAVSM